MSGVMFWVRHDFVEALGMQCFLRIERLVGEQALHRLDPAQLLCEQAWTGRHYRAIVLKFYTGLRARWDRPNSGPEVCGPEVAVRRNVHHPAPRTERHGRLRDQHAFQPPEQRVGKNGPTTPS